MKGRAWKIALASSPIWGTAFLSELPGFSVLAVIWGMLVGAASLLLTMTTLLRRRFFGSAILLFLFFVFFGGLGLLLQWFPDEDRGSSDAIAGCLIGFVIGFFSTFAVLDLTGRRRGPF